MRALAAAGDQNAVRSERLARRTIEEFWTNRAAGKSRAPSPGFSYRRIPRGHARGEHREQAIRESRLGIGLKNNCWESSLRTQQNDRARRITANAERTNK